MDELLQAALKYFGITGITALAATVGAGIALGVVRAFGKSYLNKIFDDKRAKLEQTYKEQMAALQHAHATALAHTESEIQKTFSRIEKIHEKEYEVLPKAWFLLHKAFGSLFEFVSGVTDKPNVTGMSVSDFEEFLKTIHNLQPDERNALLQSTERQKDFNEALMDVEFRNAHEDHRLFNNYLIENRIFMTVELDRLFTAAVDDMSVKMRNFLGSPNKDKARDAATVQLKDIFDTLLPEIKAVIQDRLGYHKA